MASKNDERFLAKKNKHNQIGREQYCSKYSMMVDDLVNSISS
jgi:hypothetical protein